MKHEGGVLHNIIFTDLPFQTVSGDVTTFHIKNSHHHLQIAIYTRNVTAKFTIFTSELSPGVANFQKATPSSTGK